MKIKIIVLLIFGTVSVTGAFSGCNNSKDNSVTNNSANIRRQETLNDNKANDSNEAVVSESKNKAADKASYEIVSKTYSKNNMKINYPQIKDLADKEKLNSINKNLEEEALGILDRYTKDDSNLNKVTLDVNYETKLKNDKFLSIAYVGYSNVEGAAYPTSVFYTTNMDMEKGSRIRLSDYANINDIVIKLKDPHNINVLTKEKDLVELQRNVLVNMDNAELLTILEDADFYKANGKMEMPEIGAYSYMEDDSIVISLPVNHAIGDHAEFAVKR